MIYGDKFKPKNKYKINRSIDNKTNKYCNDIIDSLSLEEKSEFGQGDGKYLDKKYFNKVKDKIIFRAVLTIDNEPISFIDVYKENRKGINYGEIAMATHSNYRGKGYASILMKDLIEWYENTMIDIDSLTYPVDINNTPSINLAVKFGFEKMSKSKYPFDDKYYNEYPVYQYKK